MINKYATRLIIRWSDWVVDIKALFIFRPQLASTTQYQDRLYVVSIHMTDCLSSITVVNKLSDYLHNYVTN